ncbi:vitelline membrane outer layer protein I [Scenedesmus sp. NREL 46B-D3]|nr:vitelline membrane outer layer protein I [Scenedesmus sp. NREL 46B-D3]
MVVQTRRGLLPALALLFLLAMQYGTAQRLLAAPHAATANAPGSSSDHTLCTNPISTYVIKPGDTPKKVVTAAYPGSLVPWRKRWGFIKACNSAALTTAEGSSGKTSTHLLTAGVTLNVPGIPRITKAHDTTDDGNKLEDPALKHLCGCTAAIAVSAPSTWLDVVSAAYPELQPAAFAANILAMCNRRARFVEGSENKMLAAGQELRSICTTIGGKSFLDFLNDAHQQADKVKAELAASEATAAAAAPGDNTVTAAQTTCSINTALSNAAVRDVSLTNACPVYTNGCSGPSDILAYQQQLTPCCQAHDWCYSCAYKAGWTGSSGKANCDYLFWDNLYRACDFWYPNDILNRGACKTTADSMFTAVSLASYSYFNNNDVCPGDSWKLANTNFCFNPVYSLNSVVSYIKPGNGQGWGSWTNYAQCPLGSWMSGFSARVQSYQGIWKDDTSLNAVRASCSSRGGTQIATGLIPGGNGAGNFGDWSPYSTCPAGKHVIAIAMQVEGWQRTADDTAANTFLGLCSDYSTVLSHASPNFGSWSSWVYCPANTAVCAFKVRVEQASAADCTSLNDIEVACCAKD